MSSEAKVEDVLHRLTPLLDSGQCDRGQNQINLHLLTVLGEVRHGIFAILSDVELASVPGNHQF